MELTVLLGQRIGTLLVLVSRKNAILAPFAARNVDTAPLNEVAGKPNPRSLVVECGGAESLFH